MHDQPRFALVPASHVYLRRGDSVLLQQRANTGYLDGYWVASAAGHVEPGEVARDAAVREVQEELGILVEPDDLDLLTVMQCTDGTDDPVEQRVDWFWSAQSWVGTPRIVEPEKCSGLQWFALDTLPDPMPAYERRLLAAFTGEPAPTVTSYGFGGAAGRA